MSASAHKASLIFTNHHERKIVSHHHITQLSQSEHHRRSAKCDKANLH